MNDLHHLQEPNSNIPKVFPQLYGTKFKQLDLKDLTLQSDRIDIWQYPLHTQWPNAEKILNKEELTRAHRYYFPRHQRRFTIARAMLRLILARYLTDVTPEHLCFTENQYGKPALVNNAQLQFNLSHSGDLALLAVGKQHSVGIDLEFFSARPYKGIGGQMFSNLENQALFNSISAFRPLTFFHIWAQKEALIKACGLGLSYPTATFDVPHVCPTNQLVYDSLHKTQLQMISFMPQVACSAAVCHHPLVTDIRYHLLSNLNDFT